MFNVIESFNWLTPEFKTIDYGKNSIKIKGVALKGNAVSRNDRRYVDEELNKAARSWIGKPVTINHNNNQKVGTVEWMEYEDGLLEYLATIKVQPYVDMIRNKSTNIRGVSIEAAYLHNQCPKCGEKFYSEEDFHNHMETVEYIKNYHTSEPHGIAGQALSLVLSPEEPGYSGTTVELMETWTSQPGHSQLLETVINEKKEIELMTKKLGDKAVLTPITRITPDRALREADEAQIKSDEQKVEDHQNPPTHPVLTTMPEDPEKTQVEEIPTSPTPNPEQPETKVTEQEEPMTCPEGYHPVGDKCVADEESVEETESGDNPDSQEPVPHPVPEPHVPTDPEEEQAETTTESPVPIQTPPEVKVIEIVLPQLLKLGEPFAGYSDHADCVAKNPEKEDPDAYCASVMRKVEGEPATEIKESHNIYETQQNLTKSLKEYADTSLIRDANQSHTINELNRATGQIIKKLQEFNNPIKLLHKTSQNIVEASNKQNMATSKKFKAIETLIQTNNRQNMSEIGHKIKEVTDKQTQIPKLLQPKFDNLATEIAKRDQTTNKNLTALTDSVNKRFSALNYATKNDVEEVTKLIAAVKEQATSNETITQLQTQVNELIGVKETFEKLLAEADKNAEARDEKIKTLEERLAESESKSVKETTDKLQEMNTKIDNLADKLKPQFKAHSQQVKETVETEDKPYVPDPNKEKK